MRAIVFPALGQAAVENVDPPAGCRSAEILVQAVYTALTNGTERNILVGGNYSPAGWPITDGIGYQHVGHVIEVGADAEGFAIGDLVYSDTAHREVNVVGTSQEALTIKVPDEVEPRDATLFGVASVAYHSVRRGSVAAAEKVLVVGAGLIGQLTAQLAAIAGGEVVIADLDEGRLGIASELGARPIRLTRAEDSWKAVREAGPFDVVFEDSGAPVLDQILGTGFPAELFPTEGTVIEGVLRPALGPARVGMPRSRVVVVAGRGNVSYNFNAAQYHEVAMLHVGHFDRSDLEGVAQLAAEGRLRLGPLICDEVEVAAAPALYSRLVEEPGSLLGTVLDWR